MSDYAGTVTLGANDPQAVLPAPYTFGPSDAGSAQLRVALRTASAAAAIGANDAASLTGSQIGIVVEHAAATSLLVSGFPSPQPQGKRREWWRRAAFRASFLRDWRSPPSRSADV